MGWRSVQSPPKDGERVLLYADNTTHPSWPSFYIEKGYRDGKQWRIVNNGDYHEGGYGHDYYAEENPGEYGYPLPTHWMRLPKPPTTPAQSQERRAGE